MIRCSPFKAFAASFLCTVAFVLSSQAKSLGWNADALSLELAAIKQLPLPPEGVTDLKFSEMYVQPVGPKGLQPTDTLLRLAGRRVRLLGFMIRQTGPSPGVIILAPYAGNTHEGEYGLCDDLPTSLVFVQVPKYRDIAVPFTPGPLLLTGQLEVGRRDEADGRVSFVRLMLDADAQTPSPIATSRDAREKPST